MGPSRARDQRLVAQDDVKALLLEKDDRVRAFRTALTSMPHFAHCIFFYIFSIPDRGP